MDDLFNNQEQTLTPALSPKGRGGGREPIFMLFKSEFDWIFQVGVTRTSNSVSPLSLWERGRRAAFR
jgi:hypothetical protein